MLARFPWLQFRRPTRVTLDTPSMPHSGDSGRLYHHPLESANYSSSLFVSISSALWAVMFCMRISQPESFQGAYYDGLSPIM